MSHRENVGNTEWPSIFSSISIEHMEHPFNVGSIDHPDGMAVINGSCGDTMEIWLKVKDNNICDIKFWTDGCETTIAAGSMATVLAKDKSITEAFNITAQDILEALGGLPGDSQHCAALAANTLRAALSDYLEFKNDPWKRLYRRDSAII